MESQSPNGDPQAVLRKLVTIIAQLNELNKSVDMTYFRSRIWGIDKNVSSIQFLLAVQMALSALILWRLW